MTGRPIKKRHFGQNCSTGRWNCRTKQEEKAEYESSCLIGFNFTVTMILLVLNSQYTTFQQFEYTTFQYCPRVSFQQTQSIYVHNDGFGRNSRINVLFSSGDTPASRILASDTTHLQKLSLNFKIEFQQTSQIGIFYCMVFKKLRFRLHYRILLQKLVHGNFNLLI